MFVYHWTLLNVRYVRFREDDFTVIFLLHHNLCTEWKTVASSFANFSLADLFVPFKRLRNEEQWQRVRGNETAKMRTVYLYTPAQKDSNNVSEKPEMNFDRFCLLWKCLRWNSLAIKGFVNHNWIRSGFKVFLLVKCVTRNRHATVWPQNIQLSFVILI